MFDMIPVVNCKKRKKRGKGEEDRRRGAEEQRSTVGEKEWKNNLAEIQDYDISDIAPTPPRVSRRIEPKTPA